MSDSTRRFSCQCPPGFYGDQCEVRKPKSCSDYWTGPIKPISREYTIEDQSGQHYQVFCEFDSEDNIVWSLVESFSLSNEPQLLPYPLTKDHPLNENNFNWDLFRLSKTRMQDIRSRSTYWRGTCSYPEYGVDYRDYTRVRLSALDPTVFIGDATFNVQACIQIDFIDIKGTNCVNCTTTIFQLNNEMLHVGPFWGREHHGCNFDTSNVEYQCPGTNERARLLGVYHACSYPSYRCSETSSSTTQIWFGEPKS